MARSPGVRIAMALLAMGAAAGALRVWRDTRTRHAGRPHVAAAPCAVLVGLCDEREKSDCSDASRAWCDVEGHEVACCAPDLVALGDDGVCACPPGGSSEGSACGAPQASAGAELADASEVIRQLSPRLHACVAGSDVASGLDGRLLAKVELTPDGRVFRLRIEDGRLASPALQACALDVLRHARFPPPRGGHAEILVPLTPDRDAR